MRRLFVVMAVLVFMPAVSVSAKGKTVTFAADRDTVFKASIIVIAEEETLQTVNDEQGIVQFLSGNMAGSLLILPGEEGKTRVTVSGQHWRGGGKNMANKFIKKLSERLGVEAVEE